MLRSKSLQRGVVIALLVAAAVPFVFAADEPQAPPVRPERGQRGPGQGPGSFGPGGFDRAAMQERMMDRIKEQLGASDEEWTVISPRLSEVMTLSRDAGSMGMMRGMFGRGGRGDRNRPGQDASTDTSAVEKASEELQQTLEKAEPSSAEIKAKLTALRGAREAAKQELAKAQEKLREVLTVKQEAQLVMIGLLD